jgi:hypothetical protein
MYAGLGHTIGPGAEMQQMHNTPPRTEVASGTSVLSEVHIDGLGCTRRGGIRMLFGPTTVPLIREDEGNDQ